MGRNNAIRSALFTLAAFAVASGWYQMFRFAATPGPQQAAPATWPETLPRVGDGRAPLLLVFVHPGCSCTHATLEQLEKLLATGGTSVNVVLEVYRSKVLDGHGYSSGLAATPWLQRRVTIAADTDGRMAHRFHAETSGELLLYSEQGRLLFQGGITPERAHLGDSLGEARLRYALATGRPQTKMFAVFGCPLFHLTSAG